MSYTASKLIAIAAGEIGYKEKETNSSLDDNIANAGDGNYTKYARDLHAKGYYQADKNGYAWCDMFVDWCFLQLCGGDAAKAQDIICQTGPYGAGCKFSADYYKNKNRFYTSNPQPGDQIFFDNYAHTGIVEEIVGSVVHTIEGNTSDQVARRTYTLGSSTIDGYGRPKYDVDNTAQADTWVSGYVSTGSTADEKTIWNFLKGKGLNSYAVAGIMGNLNAESALKSNNLEDAYQKKLGHTDASYTAAVDNGSYGNFVRDAAGYGLAQWTYWSRKQALLNYAKSVNKSVADLQMQLEFLWKELESYSGVLKALKSAASVQAASDVFMTQFENPADQSVAAKNKRAGLCQVYYNRYSTSTYDPPSTSTSPDVKLPKIGDIVEFTGTHHFISSTSATSATCKPGKAKVTALAKGNRHPVHLIAVKGAGSSVYGWVDAAYIAESGAIVVGSKVKVNTGAKNYAGGSLGASAYSNTYEVISIEGDKVVIGTGTATVNIKDITLA